MRDVILPEDLAPPTDPVAARDWGLCCHACSTLLLQCQRPGWTTYQRYSAESSDPFTFPEPCQFNVTCNSPGMESIQALYKFHKTVYRCVFGVPPFDINRCTDIGQECCYQPPDVRQCCNDFFPIGCLCGDSDLSPFRYDRLIENRCTRWWPEIMCHKDGTDTGAGRLRDALLCVVHWERWWKIPVDECAPEVRIKIPGPPVPFVTSSVVPRWWIFACSGVPVFTFDLDDAVEKGVIDAGERSSFISSVQQLAQPTQSILKKLGDAGYFATKDWRDEQQQAYAELDARFPNAGYGNCIQDPANMQLLGPIRKRAAPYLKCRDTSPTAKPLQPPLACEKDFPGGSQADYQYWKDRQWVYFRAVCGGWAYGCWDVSEDDLLQGIGRNGQCFQAVYGSVKPAGWQTCTANACSDCCNQSYYCCTDLANNCPDRCGQSLAQGCGEFNPPVPPTSCNNLMAQANCFGIRFLYAQYYGRNDICNCDHPVHFTCLYTAMSELKALQRPYNSWNESEPYQCHIENPTLGYHYCWDTLAAHYPPRPILNSIFNQTWEHNVDDFCPGARMFNYVDNIPCPQSPIDPQTCFDPDTPFRTPVYDGSCPTPLDIDQINCAGEDLKCLDNDCDGDPTQ
jgi:hypothetical protein